MSKQEKQNLIRVLESQLAQSEYYWETGKSPAFIVGYLQGLIKILIKDLEN